MYALTEQIFTAINFVYIIFAEQLLHMVKSIHLFGEDLELHPDKVIYWPSEDALLVADLHLGKVNHFRREGIPVPSETNDKNLEKLINLLHHYKPAKVIFMGDLFHSHYNTEWEVFGQVLNYFPAISFELITGNHDIMSDYQYEKYKMKLHKGPLYCRKIILSHEPMEEIPDDCYNLAGHIHPGVRLVGKGRQIMTLSCFYFGENQGLMPAFGQFTGRHKIKPKPDDRVFVITENTLIEM